MCSFIIRALLTLLGLFFSSYSIAAPISDDRVFAFAEANYPSLFPGTATDQQFQQYNYRYYPMSGNYLAVDTSGMIFMLGPSTKNVLTSVGPVTNFESAITAWEVKSDSSFKANNLKDPTVTVQAGNALFFTANYSGFPVKAVHDGLLGKGSWSIYTGSNTNRVRVTFSEQNGLQEILALDQGTRMTVQYVGQERIEYRLYSADRSFVIGSVMYSKDGHWYQGLMLTEAFGGYAALIDVEDVSANITTASAQPKVTLSSIIQQFQFPRFELISSAYAEDNKDDDPLGSLDQWVQDSYVSPFTSGLNSVGKFFQKTETYVKTNAVDVTKSIAIASVIVFAPEVVVGVAIAKGVYALKNALRKPTTPESIADIDAAEKETVFMSQAAQVPPPPSEVNSCTPPSVQLSTGACVIPTPNICPPNEGRIQGVCKSEAISLDGERCSKDGGVTYGVTKNNVCVTQVSGGVTNVIPAIGTLLNEGGSNVHSDGSVEKISCTTPISAEITINIDFEKLEITEDHIWSYGQGICSAPNHSVTPRGPDKFRWVTPFTVTDNLLNSKTINGTLSKTGVAGKYIYHNENKQYSLTYDLRGQFEILF